VRSFPFKKLDAFATAGSSGNPAAALYLNAPDDLTEAQMQRVARELKGFVSEVGFIARTGPESFTVRYFSSEKEVEFCGHATVAILYDLIASDGDLLKAPQVLLQTNMGLLPIENRVRSEDAVYVHAPLPAFREVEIDPAEICEAIGLDAARLDQCLCPSASSTAAWRPCASRSEAWTTCSTPGRTSPRCSASRTVAPSMSS
jgi:PhzF family phenazine biosynthesis protein